MQSGPQPFRLLTAETIQFKRRVPTINGPPQCEQKFWRLFARHGSRQAPELPLCVKLPRRLREKKDSYRTLVNFSQFPQFPDTRHVVATLPVVERDRIDSGLLCRPALCEAGGFSRPNEQFGFHQRWNFGGHRSDAALS